MNLISKIRSHLGLKLFVSYLIIIFTGVMVLAISANFVIPSAFNRHNDVAKHHHCGDQCNRSKRGLP